MLEALDEVRKAEQREHRSKKLLMIPATRQSEKQRLRVLELSKQYPKTGRAFRMVQALDTVYASENIDEARERFENLYRRLRKSRLEPMKKTALTLKQHSEEILNIFMSRLTNAICEGINSLIQAAKRKASGYHTFGGGLHDLSYCRQTPARLSQSITFFGVEPTEKFSLLWMDGYGIIIIIF